MAFDLNGDRGVNYLKNRFAAVGGWAFRLRWAVLLICLGLIAAGIYFASDVRFDNSFKAYFDEKDPTYQAFLDFRDAFGSDEISYILYTAPEFPHSVWNIEVMRKIRHLTQKLKTEVPFVREVTSLSNAEFIEGVQGELLVHDLLKDFPQTQKPLLELKKRVLGKPIYINGLAGKDGKYGAIILEMNRASIDSLEKIRFDPARGNAMDNLYPQITYDRIESILSQERYSDIKFYHTGDVPLNASYNRISQSESSRLALISFAVIGVLLLFFFRTALGVAGPLLVVFCSIIAAVGAIGLLSWDFDLMFIMLPALLVAVGVADAVHVLSEYYLYLDEYGDKKKAVQQTLYLVGVPCLFTSLTTMAGFASMSISSIKAIKHFAIYSSLGVGAAFLLTVTLLVVVLSFGRRKVSARGKARLEKVARGWLRTVLVRIGRFNINHKWAVLVVFAVLFGLAAVGMTRLQVDSSFLTEFSKRAEIRRVTEHVDSIMGGSTGFSYVFDSGRADGVTDPEFLKQVEAVQQKAEKKDVVMKTYSVVDILKDLNREFHEGDDTYYRIPRTRRMAAQLLLVYEMSGGEELEDYLSGDFRKARLEMRCKAVATSRYKNMVNELDGFIRANVNPDYRPELAGMGTLWLKLMEYITASQIKGFLVAFSVIAVMMCAVLGSWRVGLLSMIPNLTPIVITLGLMGWAGIPLDYVKLLIGCVAIGIAVDDTVHMITRYQHEFMVCGSYQEALFAAMRGVGRALFITSAVLVAGFLVNVFSIMRTLADFGILVAFTIFMALLADFFLLPALVLTIKPFGRDKD